MTIVHQEPSCALCRVNARMYGRCLNPVVRGVGRGFMPQSEKAVHDVGDVCTRHSLHCCLLSRASVSCALLLTVCCVVSI